jgi:hypothetical protein
MTDEELKRFIRRTDREHDIKSFVSAGGLILALLIGIGALVAYLMVSL